MELKPISSEGVVPLEKKQVKIEPEAQKILKYSDVEKALVTTVVGSDGQEISGSINVKPLLEMSA